MYREHGKRTTEGREEVKQDSHVQLLQGTSNQGYALRESEGLLTNGEKARGVTVAVAAA